MKVSITGASGYLGGCISDAFRKQGHEVLCLSRRPCGPNWISYTLGGDLQHLPWSDVDVLIHAAYDFEPREWHQIHERNVQPSIALLQAAARAQVSRIIFISSMSSFDGCRSHYGKAKLMIEQEALDLGATVVRPGLVWGEPSGGLMGALERAVAALPVVPFPSGGGRAMQFLIHQMDLSESLVAHVKDPAPWRQAPWSLAHPTPLSLHAITRTIAKRAGLSRSFLPVPWPCVMAGLRTLETLNIHAPFRSDSLTGLVHGNPAPEIAPPPAGVTFRPFE